MYLSSQAIIIIHISHIIIFYFEIIIYIQGECMRKHMNIGHTYILVFGLKLLIAQKAEIRPYLKKNKNKRKQNLRQKSFIWRLVHQRETFLWSSTSKKEHSTALAYNEIALEWCAFISIMDIFISLFILFCFFSYTRSVNQMTPFLLYLQFSHIRRISLLFAVFFIYKLSFFPSQQSHT